MPKLESVSVEVRDDRIVVAPVWAGVDRPKSSGISVGDRTLANRLVAAIEDGAAFDGEPTIETDVNGNTFVSAPLDVRGRCLNADLIRIGF